MSYEESLKACMKAHAQRKKQVAREKRDQDFDIDNSGHVDRFLRSRGIDTTAGISVNPSTALQSTAVFACIRVLAFSLAKLPLVVYRRLERGKERAFNHPVYNLLHNQPNPEINSFHWRATSMAHICLYGNAYAEIEFNGRGDPVALWLIPAWRCRLVRVNTPREKKILTYEISLPDGGNQFLLPNQVLHIPSLSIDGLTGLSLIRQAAQSIGVSLAAQDFAARFFGQGMNVGGIAEHPGVLSDTAAIRLEKTLTEQYAGLGKSHRILLLEEGMKFNKVGIPPEEAQFLESRQFQVVDIARIFGVPPHKIGDLSRATFSNIEHQAIEFVTDTMMPWFVNWEQEINCKLFNGGKEHFAEFLAEGLLRGDSVSRADFYTKLFNLASLSPNDIREKENMNPVEHGDQYFVPLNLMPISTEGTLIPPGITPIQEESRGGEGSGNFGHEGRPGEVGGSGEGGSLSPAREDFVNNKFKVTGKSQGDIDGGKRAEGILKNSSIPDSHLNTVNSIDVNTAKVNKKGGMAVAYCDNAGNIVLSGKVGTDSLEHEIGHAFWNKKVYVPKNDDKWEVLNAYKASQKTGKGFISERARADPEEYFAESYAAYARDSKGFSKANPPMGKLLNKYWK